MKILVIVNNHNSFSILNLCEELKLGDNSISYEMVCTPEFAELNQERIGKLDVEVHRLGLAPGGQFSGPSKLTETARKLQSQIDSDMPQTGRGIARRLRDRVTRGIARSSIYAKAREVKISRTLARRKRDASALFARISPDVVLTLSDRSHDYVECAVLHAARQGRVPVILPYVAQFDIDASLMYRTGADGKPLEELRPFNPPSLYKLWSYFRLRKQLYKGLFFQTPFILNAARNQGALSVYPWWVGHGLSDIVCVDSDYTLRQYIRHGVPDSKIVITGHIQYDGVFQSYSRREEIRSQIFSDYGFDKEKALLVLSVPQYAEQGYMNWDQHWSEINEIVSNCSRSGGNLLLSIHPRSNTTDYLFLQERYDCRIASQPLVEIIGAADIFLASNSTTFNWAVLCGIPALAVKSPVRSLYAHLRSIRQVEDAGRIPGFVAEILSGIRPDFKNDWSMLSRELVFDGNNKGRFRQLLRRAGAHIQGE